MKWRVICILRDLTQRYNKHDELEDYEKNMELHRSGQKAYIGREYLADRCSLDFSTRIIWLPFCFRTMLQKGKHPFEHQKTKRWDKFTPIVYSIIEGAENGGGLIKKIESDPNNLNYQGAVRTTSKGDDFATWFGLLEGLLTSYKLTWTIIIIPFVVGIISSPYFHAFISSIL